MEEGNLLSGGVEKLQEIKENLIEISKYEEIYANLVKEEEQIEKDINNLEKASSEEVQRTIKKRRTEIEEAYDKQLNNIKASIKKVKDKRDKSKNRKVSERIEDETASLREENHRLKLDAKTVFGQKHVPSYCNTGLYYALYYPRYLKDIIIILLTLMITLFIIPCGIYYFLIPEEKIIYLAIIYIITVLLFGGLYLFIGNHTKEKYAEEIRQVRSIRHNIYSNNKKIKTIKRNIKKDRDESSYGLEDFDNELSKLNNEAAEIAEQKKAALISFENNTIPVITNEIRKQYDEKISKLKETYKTLKAESSEAEEKIKVLTLKKASEYEPLIGKDLIAIDRIDSLINIIEAGNAANISEAVQFYRKNMG